MVFFFLKKKIFVRGNLLRQQCWLTVLYELLVPLKWCSFLSWCVLLGSESIWSTEFQSLLVQWVPFVYIWCRFDWLIFSSSIFRSVNGVFFLFCCAGKVFVIIPVRKFVLYHIILGCVIYIKLRIAYPTKHFPPLDLELNHFIRTTGFFYYYYPRPVAHSGFLLFKSYVLISICEAVCTITTTTTTTIIITTISPPPPPNTNPISL